MAYTPDGRQTSIFSDIGFAISSALGNKEHDPRYKINPEFTSDRKRNSGIPKYILKTEEELAADEKIKNATVSSQGSIDQNNLPDGVPKLFELGQVNDPAKLGEVRLGPLDLGGQSVDDYLMNNELQMMNSKVSNMLGQGGTALNYNALNNAMAQNVNPNAAAINEYVNQNAFAPSPSAPSKTPFVDKRTRFGNFMATIGGDDYKTAEELNNMSEKDREAYLKQRDKQMYGGIAEAIAIADDQFNRRNVNEGVAIREKNEQARLEAEKERQGRISKIQYGASSIQNDPRYTNQQKQIILNDPALLEEYANNNIKGLDAKNIQDRIFANQYNMNVDDLESIANAKEKFPDSSTEEIIEKLSEAGIIKTQKGINFSKFEEDLAEYLGRSQSIIESYTSTGSRPR
tara:strand:+ start:4926 stop:6131 length:1206 start_codon:yes stop_codon:yes gene_type:complete